MTPTHLTNHKLKRAKVGEVVYYKGDEYQIKKIGNKYVHLESIEGKIKKVTRDEIDAYTKGIADAQSAYVKDLKEHMKEVRSGRYLSKYFMQPKRGSYE